MKRLTGLAVLLPWMLVQAWSVEEGTSPDLDWEVRWNDLNTIEDLSPVARLLRQTELVEAAGEAVGWSDRQVWDWTRQVLSGWENSADLEAAYSAYMELLEKVATAAGQTTTPLPDEEALRGFYQRALSIARSSLQEGRLYYYLAESLQRGMPASPEKRRRVEAFLQQAALSLADAPPMDAVQLRLAELYRDWQSALPDTERAEESYRSRAVFHYRYILGMASSREVYREAAEAGLEELLRPDLELRIPNRFLPENDVRIPVRTLNITKVNLEVYRIAWQEQLQPVSYSTMLKSGPDSLPPEALVLSKTFNIQPRHRFDWNLSEFRLGEDFPGGWYWVRISGGGLTVRDLMLVSPLEVVAIPRDEESLSIWVVDAETGRPVPQATFSLLDRDGTVIYSGNSGPDGTADLELPSGVEWGELHATDGVNPGLVLNSPDAVLAGPQPWIIPGPSNPVPGGSLSWILMDNPASPDKPEEALKILFPDGSMVEASMELLGENVFLGQASIPETIAEPGPAYLIINQDERVIAGHIRTTAPLPVRIELTGERFDGRTRLFLSTTPVGVRIAGNSLAGREDSEYVRVRVVPVRRNALASTAEQDSGPDEPVYENILNLGGRDDRQTYFEIPDPKAADKVQVLRVEVNSLATGELMGESYLGILPFRTLVSLSTSEHLVRVGDTVEVRMDYIRAEEASSRSLQGDLVVFRETWESRYIHRKRGTLLSEADYQQLPDRSLLGSAKTDYRLLEQGFIREEVSRLPVDLENQKAIPITLERAGYYHVEFDGREMETLPTYPDGPLEVWVIPEQPELRTFRSVEPRLVTEKGPDNRQQILVLLDRKEVAVLLDLEFVDGSFSSEVINPASSAVYREELLSGRPELASCKVFIVGDRETDVLCRHLETGARTIWELQADRSTGFNPGADFEWTLGQAGGSQPVSAVWTIYPENGTGPVLELLQAQVDGHRRNLHERLDSYTTLGNWLPVYHPFVETLERDPSESVPLRAELDPQVVLALFPEIRGLQDPTSPGIAPGLVPAAGGSTSRSIQGDLPQVAGRWSLALFSLREGGYLDWQTWPFSTELPIRTLLSGPGLLRPGDRPKVSLELVNTTRRGETLDIQVSAEGSVELESEPRLSKSLGRGQQDIVEVEVRAIAFGPGRIRATARGGKSESQAEHALSVITPDMNPVIRSFVVKPGDPEWTHKARLEGWTDPRLRLSSGLGGFLGELWPVQRQHLAAEPLLQALGDWALARVSEHHGLDLGDAGDPGPQLLQQLATHASSGGWAWTAGADPDPWLSALVLWSLETFSSMAEPGLDLFKLDAQDYLESVLIDEDINLSARLFALHALASPAYNDPRVRPSRIQARSFLSFLHDRDQLNNANFASLLQVARAYRFPEEVRLLVPELMDRVRTRGISAESGFWARSLVYMALGEVREVQSMRASVLQGALASLTSTEVRRSWLQAGGFLNLLAVFLWEGDFNVDGTARLQIGDAIEPLSVSLRPDSPGKGRFSVPLSLGELPEISLRLDVGNASRPVILTLTGLTRTGPAWLPFPEQSERLFREYVENTLLAGLRNEVRPLSEESVLKVGDTLQVFLSVYVEEPHELGEFHFLLPACASLAGDSIQHFFEPSSTSAIMEPPVLRLMEQEDPMRQVMRMEPLFPGRHEFTLSYRITASGTFAFPSHLLFIPTNGQIFQIGNSRYLTVEPE